MSRLRPATTSCRYRCLGQYHVVEGQEFDAFYRLTNPDQQITAHVFDAVRSQVPTMTLDHVFEKKSDIEEAVSIGLKTKINNYGYDIDGSPVTDIQPDEKVRAAMNEINAASRLREAAEQQGEAVRIKTVKAAEAEKESKKLQGEASLLSAAIAAASATRSLRCSVMVGSPEGHAHADPHPAFHAGLDRCAGRASTVFCRTRRAARLICRPDRQAIWSATRFRVLRRPARAAFYRQRVARRRRARGVTMLAPRPPFPQRRRAALVEFPSCGSARRQAATP